MRFLQKEPSAVAHRAPAVAYLCQGFPDLTLTFIYREVLALERQGLTVATHAIWKVDKGKLSPESRYFVDRTRYVFPVSWPRFFLAHFYFFLTRPRRYVRTLIFVLTRNGESLRNRLRTLFHFAEAVYLAKDMKKEAVDHIHAHFVNNAATAALVISRLLGISFSFTAHNILFTDRPLLLEKIREARFVVAISEFTRQFLLDFVPGEKVAEKIHVVHCGLEPRRFLPPDPKPAKEIPVILFVGQLAERKGAPVLLEACRNLREQGLRFRCLIVGDGPQRTIVESLISDYGLKNVVELKGAVFQEGLKEFLGAADIFVLPCLRASDGDMDGIPVSLMEAMAMEIPAVSTFVSGIPELIKDGESGLLVPEKDPAALADALRRLLLDKGLRSRLGKKGREKVCREFDVDKSAGQLKNLFERYIRTHG